ncbi:transglutaminase TgpA family protein [Sphaerisporangium aureirubrum]|uniref:DUF3488 and DUF4129 domain-containing transglutaminase family protein n=1 Tax=Sphaerisporangium aureirubrum TaxID=1544736 RepID=A0ABW1NV86_9ACTN
MRLPIAAGLATAAVSLTLYPLFQDGPWFWTGLGAIMLITAVSVGTTLRSVPRWLGPPAELAVLLVFLTAVFAPEEAWWGFIPTFDALGELAVQLADGFDDIQKYAAPVPSNTGITLLTAGGIGLIAVLTDLLAVRLGRAALAGLPLLALFTVPAAVMTDPIGWPAFIIAALGYVGLLAADGRERLGRWGRAVLLRRSRITGARVQSAETTPLSPAGKRIGVAAIALAIALPALLPTLSPNPLFGFGVGSSGEGGNTITIPNPIASLRGQLTQPANATVLTYTNNDDVPRYLRMYSLDTFDGTQWTMSQPRGRPEDRVSENPLPPAPGLSLTAPLKNVTTRVTVSEGVEGLSFLPLPYPASAVRIEGDWRADQSTLMVFSTRDTAGGAQYQVDGWEPQPTPESLTAAQAYSPDRTDDRYLTLPGNLPPEIGDTAARLVRDASTPYEGAVMLQEWFTTTGGFTYSLQTQGNGSEALLDFLRNKKGYCEQFAATMAVMARAVGIPARVGIGYTGGTKINNVWQVRTHDLHAWPELYFEGAGWLRFEPTPSGGLGQATARVPEYSRPVADTDDGDGNGATPSAAPNDSELGQPSLGPRRDPRDPDPGLGTDPLNLDQGTPLYAKIGIAAGILALLALVPAALRLVAGYRRRRTWSRVGTVPAPPPPGGPAPPGPAGTARAETAGAASAPPGPAGTARVEAPGTVPARPGPTGTAGPEAAGAVPARPGPEGEAARRAEAVARQRLRRAVYASWRELTDTLVDLGMGYTPSETPRALARRLVEHYEFTPGTAASVTRIASAEERLRYARTPGEITSLAADLKEVRRALRATVPRSRRLRATLLPTSTLIRLRGIGESILDAFDHLETLRLWPRRAGSSAPPADDRELTTTGSR